MKKSNTTYVIIAIVAMVLSILAIVVIFTVYKDITKDSGKNEWKEMINTKENKVIYFGRKSCTWCTKYKPILEAIKEKYGVEYEYIDTDSFYGFEELLTYLGNDYTTFSTPYTVIVRKGKKVAEIYGYAEPKTVFEFYKNNKLIDSKVIYEDIVIDEQQVMIDSTKENYPNLNVLNYEEYEKMINNNSKNILIVGQTTCGYCTEYKETLNKIADDGVIINYIDIDILSQENYTKLMDSLDFFKNKTDWGTPLTLIIENKKVKDYTEGIKNKTDTINYYKSHGLME